MRDKLRDMGITFHFNEDLPFREVSAAMQAFRQRALKRLQ